MKQFGSFARRGFLGAGLVALGGGIGWIARRLQRDSANFRSPSIGADNAAVYDVSEYEKTDPALLLYEPAGQFPTGFNQVKRIQPGPAGQLLVAGDRGIRFFTASGTLQREVQFDHPPHCMQLLDHELLVGLANFFVILDLDGREKLRSPRLGDRTFLTALAVHEQTVYLADAGGREVLMADRGTGKLVNRFGKKTDTNPGFAVPSPYFDLALGLDHRLHVANPGRLRIETYTLDGRFESAWGQPGLGIDRFCGCCNPVYFAIASDGRFMTSEKGLARINLYDAGGAFRGAVAGPEVLVDDKALAKRACQDCSVGAGFDLAITQDQSVHVLDPFRKTVRRFAPKATT